MPPREWGARARARARSGESHPRLTRARPARRHHDAKASKRASLGPEEVSSAEQIFDELFLTTKERRIKEKRKLSLKATQAKK